MDAGTVREVFEEAGCLFLYERFHYQFYVTGLFTTLENPAPLELLLETFDFQQNHPLLFDDFSYYFKTLHYSFQKRIPTQESAQEWGGYTL